MVHKVNKATVRFNEFSEVPKVFNLVDLSVSGISNGVFNDPKKVGSGYRLINVKDMYDTDCVDTEKLTLLNIENKEFNKNKVQYGDIFFTRSSIVPSGIAYSNVCLSNAEDITFDGHLMKLSPNLSFVEPSYLAYKLRTWTMRTRLIRRGKQSTMTTIGQSDIADIPVELPTIEEQQKIASFLSKVDEKITLLTEKKAKLTEYKKGVMQQLFDGSFQEQDGKLVFVPPTLRFKADDGSEFTDWEEKALGDVCQTFSGGTPVSSNKSFYGGDIPFIGSGNIFDLVAEQYITQDGYNSSSAKMIEKGDLLYALYGATSGQVSISKLSGAINQAVLCIRTNQNKLFLYSLLGFMKESILSRYLQGGQGNLSAQIIKKLVICFPSLNEQKKIANFLSTIDQKIDLASSELEKAKEWKKGLLQQMFV